ncbi:hypothetical protein A2U01_0060997, partial [Trifolium medium]|nr:hypothetical protein [Trifolium medium]
MNMLMREISNADEKRKREKGKISTRFVREELFEREAGVSKTSCSYGDEKKMICNEKVART